MAAEETELLQEISRRRETSSFNQEKPSTLPKPKKISKNKKKTACCARHAPVDLSNREEGICHRLSVVMVLSLMVLLLLLLSLYKSVQPDDSKSMEQIREDVDIDIAQLKRKTLQDHHFWQEVEEALNSILGDETISNNAFVLLATPIGTEKAATCLSHHISDIVYHAFEDSRIPVVHDTRKFLSMSPADHKLALDNELMGLNSSHSAVIYNLELMPAETATLLHGYCDNDNAPFKRAMIFLLVEINTPYQDVPVNKLDSFMENFFFKMYGPQLDPDHIPGLVSRLTPQVVLVRPESQETLSRVCV